MSLTAHSQFSKCFFCSKDATDRPIGGSVGKGGANHKADVRIVQAFLNSTPPEDGGPAFLLAEDGIIGPKTQAAIDKFQAKVLRHPAGSASTGGPDRPPARPRLRPRHPRQAPKWSPRESRS